MVVGDKSRGVMGFNRNESITYSARASGWFDVEVTRSSISLAIDNNLTLADIRAEGKGIEHDRGTHV